MKDTKNTSRRRILQTLLAGGAVATNSKLIPDTWIKPVVDAVSIPAHAEFSGDPDFPTGFFSGGSIVSGSVGSGSEVEMIASGAPENPSGSVLELFDDSVNSDGLIEDAELMDFFIDSANAAVNDTYQIVNCTTLADSFDIAFDVRGNPGPVDVCVTDIFGSSYTVRSIDGTVINSFSVPGYTINVNSVSVDGISGSYFHESKCMGNYTAPRVPGSFSCANTTSEIIIIGEG